MLHINAFKGQTIYIDELGQLTIDEINSEGNSILATITDGNRNTYKTQFEQGHAVQLFEQVIFTLSNILVGKKAIAVLGFDAPRYISIKGDWQL